MVDEAPNMNGKDKPMESGVSTTDVGVLAGLYGGISGGRGGYGGYGGGYGGGGSQYGNHSAIRADVKANRDIDMIEAINKNTTDGFLQTQIVSGNANLSDKVDTEASNRRFSDLQSQIGGMVGSLQAELSRQALAAAECCCENRVAAAKAEAKLDSILANQVQDRNDAQHNDLRNRIDDIDRRRH